MSPTHPTIVLTGEDIKRLANYDIPEHLKDIPYDDMIEALTSDRKMEDIMSLFAVIALVRIRDFSTKTEVAINEHFLAPQPLQPSTEVSPLTDFQATAALFERFKVFHQSHAAMANTQNTEHVIHLPTEDNEHTVHFYFKKDGSFDGCLAYRKA